MKYANRLMVATAIATGLAGGGLSGNAYAADAKGASPAPALQLAQVRVRPLSDCDSGYAKTAKHTEGKYIVYECVNTLRCGDGFVAEQYEVVGEGNNIVQRYRCKALDKSQTLSADVNNS